MEVYDEWVMGLASDNWIRDEFTGAEAGWRAALGWIKTHPDVKDPLTLSIVINQELKEN